MTRYKQYIQQIQNPATVRSIGDAVMWLTEDIIDFLIASGVKQGAPILDDIRKISKYDGTEIPFSNNQP